MADLAAADDRKAALERDLVVVEDLRRQLAELTVECQISAEPCTAR